MLAALFPVLDDNGRAAEKAKRDSMELYCVYKKHGPLLRVNHKRVRCMLNEVHVENETTEFANERGRVEIQD